MKLSLSFIYLFSCFLFFFNEKRLRDSDTFSRNGGVRKRLKFLDVCNVTEAVEGWGQMVRMLPFNSKVPSSNPAKFFSFKNEQSYWNNEEEGGVF